MQHRFQRTGLAPDGFLVDSVQFADEYGGSGNLDSGDKWNFCLTSA